jgi:hypothetical protein
VTQSPGVFHIFTGLRWHEGGDEMLIFVC